MVFLIPNFIKTFWRYQSHKVATRLWFSPANLSETKKNINKKNTKCRKFMHLPLHQHSQWKCYAYSVKNNIYSGFIPPPHTPLPSPSPSRHTVEHRNGPSRNSILNLRASGIVRLEECSSVEIIQVLLVVFLSGEWQWHSYFHK